jgi:hypothetical protein
VSSVWWEHGQTGRMLTFIDITRVSTHLDILNIQQILLSLLQNNFTKQKTKNEAAVQSREIIHGWWNKLCITEVAQVMCPEKLELITANHLSANTVKCIMLRCRYMLNISGKD